MSLQPFLHDLLPTVAAPTQLWLRRDGHARGRGAEGLFHTDARMLSRLELRVGGSEPEIIALGQRGPGVSEAIFAARSIDGPGPDPTTWVRQLITLTPGLVQLALTLECATAEPVSGPVELVLASDLASLEQVKQGFPTAQLPFAVEGTTAQLVSGARSLRLDAPGAELSLAEDGALRVRWHVTTSPGAAEVRTVRIELNDGGAVVHAPTSPEPEWRRPRVVGDDARFARLTERCLDDLAGLRLTWERAPGETFLAAGAPWFFTLFGRDSLWAARLLLPIGTELARGTLRALASGQGSRTDQATAEQPGKILHEVRAAELALADGMTLPPVYYGTVDATALWICLLHDAWRWGMAREDVAVLLPHLERALEWLRDHADADGDGFLDYHDATGSGLSNQGWKDSGDSIQWRDGTLAEGPIALVEVQAYAYEAAVGGAALLEKFGRPGAEEWRTWAADLARRFRAKYWTSDDAGPYLGVALDRHGALVDSVASNMGHVIGTGILNEAEEALVAERLVGVGLSSGYGLRTLSQEMGGFWPLGYHRGSVWTHDTAIAILGLSRAGFPEHAAQLTAGLLAAAEQVAFQPAELHGGSTAGSTPGLVAYPAACHPQAWSAASAVALLQATLGLSPGPDGVPHLDPAGAGVLGSLAVDGVRMGGRTWRVQVGADGSSRVAEL